MTYASIVCDGCCVFHSPAVVMVVRAPELKFRCYQRLWEVFKSWTETGGAGCSVDAGGSSVLSSEMMLLFMLGLILFFNFFSTKFDS